MVMGVTVHNNYAQLHLLPLAVIITLKMFVDCV